MIPQFICVSCCQTNFNPMNVKMKVTNFLWLVLCLIQSLSAQQGIVSSGDYINYFNGSVSYSIGQVSFGSFSSEAGNVNQGLQQPFQFSIVGTSDLHRNSMFLLHPNPANQNLYLQLSTHESLVEVRDFYVMVYDMQGKLLITQRLNDDVNTISINVLPAAMYFIQVWQANKFIQSVSFTKTN